MKSSPDTNPRARSASAIKPPPWQPGARLRIDLAYLGSAFHGWQIQPALRTVQGDLAALLERLLGRPVLPVGAGRTDAGVHARGQVCHVEVATAAEAERLQRILPEMVPDDVQVTWMSPVSGEFDARRSATSRRYSYHLRWRRDVFAEPFALRVGSRLDREAMTAAAVRLAGVHDFTSFCKRSSLKPHGNECRVDLCRFQWESDSAIFRVRADRFLHNMVRNMVGTLLEVGQGKLTPEQITDILSARDRGQAGRKAAAKGLFLEEVTYPGELLDPSYRSSSESGSDSRA